MRAEETSVARCGIAAAQNRIALDASGGHHCFERFSAIKVHEIADSLSSDRIECIVGKESLMGGDNNIGKGQQSREDVILNNGTALVIKEEIVLLLLHIEPEKPDLAAFERFNYSACVDQTTATGVDEHHPRLHLGYSNGVDQMMVSGREWSVKSDDVAGREQSV